MSDIISVKTLSRLAGASLIALSLGACSQMMKHSNTLVFTTNTSVGVNVGQDASQTPAVQIGFQRQEVAFVPVLANTAVGENGDLVPCPAPPGASSEAIEAPTGCMFQASMDGTDRDAYSVLASFGAEGSGANSGSMTVAQYFATGIAAQRLAENGGANVVSAGGASKEIAEAVIAAAEAKKAEQEAIKARATARLDTGEIGAKAILADPSGNVQTAKRKALEAAMGDPNCGTDSLQAYDAQPIDTLITYLKTRRARCLRSYAKILSK